MRIIAVGVASTVIIIGVVVVGAFFFLSIFDPIDNLPFGSVCDPGYYPISSPAGDTGCCPPPSDTFDGTHCSYIPRGGNTSPDTMGEIRNCIKRVMSDGPSCSDTSGRILPTTCNGSWIGDMSYSMAKGKC